MTAATSTSADQTIASIYRAEWGRLLSLLVARTRRLDLAEDALGEAFAQASQRWPTDGAPANPTGWLYTTAHRHILGRLRAEGIAGRKAPLLAVRPDWVAPGDPSDELDRLDQLPDERLHLILLCCHPALPPESRSGLALRLVIGTSTEQIARLFLVSTTTMAARLTRAKKKIAVAGIPLGAPVADELRSRLDEVCRTVYLAFTAGYTPGSGPDLLRADEAGEAVRLAALLHDLVPEAPQVRAMLALLLLQHSRRDARQVDGALITLPDQDRSRWHQNEIKLGLELIQGLPGGEHNEAGQADNERAHGPRSDEARPAIRHAEPGGYAQELRLQALIAAEHARAATAEATDWATIADHYGALEALTGSAVIRLNRAVAVAEAEGPQTGLSLLSGLDDLLPDNHRVPAIRADLAHRAGDPELARISYRRALDLCSNQVERSFLQAKLAGLEPTDM